MNGCVKLNFGNIKRIEGNINKALILTGEAVERDLRQSETMPFDSGALQNRFTFTDVSDAENGEVRIVSDTPYARRLYFHPEYNFSREHNPNAGGEWFQPYISGEKKTFAQDMFCAILKRRW